MSGKIVQLRKAKKYRNATSRSKGRQRNDAYRVREHLTETEMDKLLAALKDNRHGHRDWLVGLIIYRHGLRVSEVCDLRWDDIDLRKRTVIVRRLKGSTDSVHYLERDEVNGLKLLRRQQQVNGIKGAYVFINERGQPFGRMGIGRMVERAGEAARLPFPVHVHMLRHSTGYALAGRGMDTRRLQHFLGHASITNTVRYTAMSPEPFKDIWR
jgi:site-specific recombinase XerD